MAIDARDIQRVRPAVTAVAHRTPVLSSRALTDRAGGAPVLLKAENLQRTGSFKIRGATAKLTALGDAAADGVVCASAGNHGQGVAAAAAARGIPCDVFVPGDAPIAKVEAMEAAGATIHRAGSGVDECLGFARAHADERDLPVVHPFDDAEIVAGQGTLGLELVEDVEDLARVIVPIGGGGLASGVALALKAANPAIHVIGVRAAPARGTLADGIAVKHPGKLTGPLLEALIDERVEVGETELAEAMYVCLERAKLVVEGAGAASVAALLSGAAQPAQTGATVVVLSGGNVDAGVLATVARRHETRSGRRVVVYTRVPDRPGGLVAMLEHIASLGANVVDVFHVREAIDLNVRETAVELVLETRGATHAEAILADLDASGYSPKVQR